MFDPLRILYALADHGVRYVLIGGMAGTAHGSPAITDDLDICYERSETNLERLAEALRELGARLRGRGVPEDVPFQLDARTLQKGDAFTFVTEHGEVDVMATPAGTSGYEELAADAVPMRFELVEVQVASIDALIRMKRAAGRPKDRVHIEFLGALRDELEERGEDD